VRFIEYLPHVPPSASSAVGILKIIGNTITLKVKMPGNYILPERDDIVPFVFQTEPHMR